MGREPICNPLTELECAFLQEPNRIWTGTPNKYVELERTRYEPRRFDLGSHLFGTFVD